MRPKDGQVERNAEGHAVAAGAGLYKRFEDKFRGSRELVKSRLAAYAPFLEVIETAHGPGVAVDVGCGRGEWLDVLKERGWTPTGVDLNEDMLADARALGLDVRRGDALEYLRSVPEGSLGLVSAMHVVEHVAHDYVVELVRSAYAALRPGGLLVLETPNPENVSVAAWSFHLDPSHTIPLPPELLSFLVRDGGFETAEILTLNGAQPSSDQGPTEKIVWTLFTASPDYAVLGVKGSSGGDEAERIASLASERSQPRPGNIVEVTAIARAADRAATSAGAAVMDRLEAVGHAAQHHDLLILERLAGLAEQLENATRHSDVLLRERLAGVSAHLENTIQGRLAGGAEQLENTIQERFAGVAEQLENAIQERLAGVSAQLENTIQERFAGVAEQLENARHGNLELAGQIESVLQHEAVLVERINGLGASLSETRKLSASALERSDHAARMSDSINHHVVVTMGQLTAELAAMRNNLAQLNAVNAGQAAALSAMRSSTSWRVTAPLRAVGGVTAGARRGVFGAIKGLVKAPMEMGLRFGRRHPAVARAAFSTLAPLPVVGPRLVMFAQQRGYLRPPGEGAANSVQLDATAEATAYWRKHLSDVGGG